MKFSFANGTQVQQDRWAEVAGRLLNLPDESLPLDIEVSFVDAGTLAGAGPEHTTLAETTWTYDDSTSTCEVRDDAPSFGSQEQALRAEAARLGLVYNPDRFYTESAGHEVGHSAFAALPETSRVAIAQMFGADSDDVDSLFPEGTAWQNKIGEGIAETFKEAFLPRRYRVFPNRTNRTISYDRFPEFRALFRQGVEGILGSGGFSHDVLELDSANMRVAWPLSAAFEHEGSNSYYTVYQAGYDLFSAEIPTAHTFDFSWLAPALDVILIPGVQTHSTIFFSWRYRIKVNGITVDKFRGVWAGARPASPNIVEFYVDWYRPASLEWDDVGDRVPFPLTTWNAGGVSLFVPNEIEKSAEEGWTANYRLWEDAIPLGPLPQTLSSSVSVEPGDTVSIHARALGLEWAVPGGPNFEEEAKARMGRYLDWSELLPLMHYSEPGAEAGSPIILPSSALDPTGAQSGRRATRRPRSGIYVP